MEYNYSVLFNSTDVVFLTKGLVYHNKTKLYELEEGTYDPSYLISIIDQCKRISRTIPFELKVIGITYSAKLDRYDLICE